MRTDRRTFLKDAAGLVFVGCSVADAAARQSPRAATARRAITIKGKRIATVDMHAHCAVPRANDLLRRAPPAPPARQGSRLGLEGDSLSQRVAAMDAQGIDVAVLSINPNWYDADRD